MLRKDRSRRPTRSRSPSPSSRSRWGERSEQSRKRNRSYSPRRSASSPLTTTRRGRRERDGDLSSASSSRSSSPDQGSSRLSKSMISPIDRPNANQAEFDWKTAAWSVGSRVLDELLAMARREHYVRSEQRQLHTQVVAATAYTNNQLWATVATWGTWGAQALMMHYFGMPFNIAQRLLTNGS